MTDSNLSTHDDVTKTFVKLYEGLSQLTMHPTILGPWTRLALAGSGGTWWGLMVNGTFPQEVLQPRGRAASGPHFQPALNAQLPVSV